MKNILTFLSTLVLVNISYANMHVVNYYSYFGSPKVREFPSYLKYLDLFSVSEATKLNFLIRQPAILYPGDYFYPPDAFTPRDAVDVYSSIDSALYLNQLDSFITTDIIIGKNDSKMLFRPKWYGYDFPDGHRCEAYNMLVDEDTVYVISGWLGKFISFYRVVPGDRRLTPPDLIGELDKLTPLSKEIDIKKFRQESDTLNYLLEYVDKDKMFRIRNYLMKSTLPPAPPDAPESFHNLIEITRFYDKEAIP